MAEGKTNMFGKTYNTIGSTDSNFIIKTKGDLKVQWGSKYIDIIKNGKINTDNKILKTASSVEDIKQDGIYLIEPDQLWVMINGTKIQLSGDSSTTFVSFLQEQKEVTAEQKNTALTNIGFYYNTFEEAQAAGLQSGLIYVQGDNKLYIIKDGIISEYMTNITQEESNTVEDVIKTPEKLYIDGYSLKVDGVEYATLVSNIITLYKNLSVGQGIQSIDATNDQGFRLYIQDGQSYLEVDHVIERQVESVDDYEYIKIYSQSNNFTTKAYVDNNDEVICVLQEPCDYKEGDYIYIVGNIDIVHKYQNGNITFYSNKVVSYDIEGSVDGVPFVLAKNTSEVTVPGTEDSEIYIKSYKDLFEYQIQSVYNNTLTIKDGDTFFIDNCNYVYLSRKPLIYINNNNIDLIDRSISYDDEVDNSIHTRLGIIKDLEKQYNKDIETSVGLYSDNFVGIGSKLYNTTFKALDEVEYPKYDETLLIPQENKDDNKYNQIVPNIQWVKELINSIIPAGTIVMWNGSSVPKGWALCDGTNGTPNLVGSFIKGSDVTDSEPTVPEGINSETNEFTLETKHLPEHRHPHTHTLSELSGTAESTTIEITSDTTYLYNNDTDSASTDVEGASTVSVMNGQDYRTVTSSGSHSHTVTISGGTIQENTEAQDKWEYGETTPFKIEPKHFKVMFIMKIAETNN